MSSFKNKNQVSAQVLMVTCGMCVRYQKCIDGGQIHDDVESAVFKFPI